MLYWRTYGGYGIGDRIGLEFFLSLFVSSPADSPNFNVHAFYYAWYGTPEFDGEWLHWNHQLLPHWSPSIAQKFPQGKHVPPDDIGGDLLLFHFLLKWMLPWEDRNGRMGLPPFYDLMWLKETLSFSLSPWCLENIANFYPSLGPYSSKDPNVIEDHMRQLKSAKIGVAVLSWYNPDRFALVFLSEMLYPRGVLTNAPFFQE